MITIAARCEPPSKVGFIADKARDDSADSEADRAVKDLDKAIEDYNKSILDGDTHPDTGRIDAAADRLKDVCTS